MNYSKEKKDLLSKKILNILEIKPKWKSSKNNISNICAKRWKLKFIQNRPDQLAKKNKL